MATIIVHGGAWDIPEKEHSAYLRGCDQVVVAGHEALSTGGTSFDAVETGVRWLEDDPTFDAGRGLFLNAVGEVEMDAMIMQGKELRFGSVAAVRHIRHPITLVRHLMEDTGHCMIFGQGAEDFARSINMEIVPTTEPPTEREIVTERLRSAGSGRESQSRAEKSMERAEEPGPRGSGNGVQVSMIEKSAPDRNRLLQEG